MRPKDGLVEPRQVYTKVGLTHGRSQGGGVHALPPGFKNIVKKPKTNGKDFQNLDSPSPTAKSWIRLWSHSFFQVFLLKVKVFFFEKMILEESPAVCTAEAITHCLLMYLLYWGDAILVLASFHSIQNKPIGHLKGSGDVDSAVCYTIYTIYLSLSTQTAETTSPETYWEFPCSLGKEK